MTNDENDQKQINWDKAYNTETFKEIKKRRFIIVVPMVIVFTILFLVLFTVQNYIPELANAKLVGYVNFSFLYTMILFPLVWVAGFYYSKYTTTKLHPQEEEIVKEFGRKE